MQALTILLSLRQQEIHIAEDLPERPGEAPVVGPGAIGDAGVDHGNTGSASVREAHEVRPEFRFRKHDKFRAQGTQVRVNRKSEIQREIEGVVRTEALLGEGVARVGGGRNHDTVLGKGLMDPGNQARDGQDFADRNGMDPDQSLARDRGQCVRHFPHTLGKTAPVLSVARDLEEPERQAQ